MTLEREIYSIETANINKETLDAMKNAGSAMKQIHANLTIDKVDTIMYVFPLHPHASHLDNNTAFTNTVLIAAGKICAINTQSAKKSAKQ